MKFLLGFCLVAVAVADEVMRCPGATEEKIAEMKKLIVTDDVHEKMHGQFTQLYGPKAIFDMDEKSCIKMNYHKVDDKHVELSAHMVGDWFKGEHTRNSTLEKIENGVYISKRDGEPKAKVFILYDSENVFAHFACWFHAPPADSNMSKLKGVASVSVHTEAFKTPLDAAVQTQVDEAVHKLQEHKELLGEITQYTHHDC